MKDACYGCDVQFWVPVAASLGVAHYVTRVLFSLVAKYDTDVDRVQTDGRDGVRHHGQRCVRLLRLL